ncbi:MAG: replicative DNA helicase [Eubacteriales bacterium]|nr:replicative DNA helicase [Eubacteriales bacterium]
MNSSSMGEIKYPAGRIPPQNLDAERAVLAASIYSEESFDQVIGVVEPEDFYDRRHGLLYSVCLEMREQNIPLDLVSITEYLERKNQLEAAGGVELLSDLVAPGMLLENARHYAKLVHDKRVLRDIIASLYEVIDTAYGDSTVLNEVLDLAAKRLIEARNDGDNEGFRKLGEILAKQLNILEEQARREHEDSVKSGFPLLDKTLGGLKKGALIVLASRPGMGKSSFALNVAQLAAMVYNKRTAIFTLEMSREEIAKRFLASYLSIDSKRLSTGDLEPEEWEKMGNEFPTIYPTPIFIDDRSGITAPEMLAKCRQLQLEEGLDLVVIDYLQLMQGTRRNSDNRQQEISDISRHLKIMARELDCPVIALSQLSRACEARADKRPMLSDLRDSGAIEQDADVVLFLYRDAYYNEREELSEIEEAELIVAKNRHGETRNIALGWNAKYTRYFEQSKRIQAAAEPSAPPEKRAGDLPFDV